MTAGPLQGIRVLDISTFLAGPYAATLLGDLGADVIKIEPPAGDESRHLGPERAGERGPFIAVNRNKRDIVLDLRDAGDHAVFDRLVATADAFITNVREPALSKLGLDYDAVRKHKPDIIWVGVTAFGPDGPYAGRPGIDFLAQAIAGLISLTGEPDGPPLRVSVPMVDVMTSVLVSTGILAALHERGKSGLGQRIDVSLLDALLHAQATGLAGLFLVGEVTPRTGNRSRFFAPSGIYETSDGKRIAITCPTEKFFRNFARAVEPAWLDDARFQSIDLRMEHQDALDAEIARCCKALTRDELMQRLVAADVLAAPVNELPDVIADPQVLHNEMIVETQHAAVGPVNVTGIPIKLRRTPGSIRRAPPVLGQHTEEIMKELGCTEEEIAAVLTSAATRSDTDRHR
jgi:crotonobetainyl-CoA:carnitine CoA-transferase CaiB-like acyl-CoA transferase